MWELDCEESWAPKNWCFWIVVSEKTLESPLDCKEIQSVHPKGDQFWKDWCWSWNANILATSWEELTHWKRPWYWEGLGARGEGDNKGWDGWIALPSQWAWVWVDSGSLWWTGRPGVLRFMRSQRVGHDWGTELTWTDKPSALPSEAKNLPANTRDVGGEDPLEKEMVTHSVFLPGKSHGQRSLAGYSPWACKESDTS